MNFMQILTSGIEVSPETHEKLMNAHKFEKRVSDAFGEALKQMSPDDNTPYRLTVGELGLDVASKLGLSLGN